MSWVKVTIALDTSEVAQFETVMEANGAAAVIFESQSDEVVLEPQPGAIPLWQHINLVALFSADTPIIGLNAALRELDPQIHRRLQVDFIANEDWQQRLANHTIRAQFGGRLWLVPKTEKQDPKLSTPGQKEPGSVEPAILYLEPGLAFGSGSHPTTRMCLEWIAKNIQPGQRVLDFGCGSGILAIGAALLGATVVAVDYDDQALLATNENAAFNSVREGIQTLSLDQWEAGRVNSERQFDRYFDVVVANILAAPIIELAQTFSCSLAVGGSLTLSGILDHQAEQVLRAYPGVTFAPAMVEAEWVCLTGSLA